MKDNNTNDKNGGFSSSDGTGELEFGCTADDGRGFEIEDRHYPAGCTAFDYGRFRSMMCPLMRERCLGASCAWAARAPRPATGVYLCSIALYATAGTGFDAAGIDALEGEDMPGGWLWLKGLSSNAQPYDQTAVSFRNQEGRGRRSARRGDARCSK
jgi:hypothetical protein